MVWIVTSELTLKLTLNLDLELVIDLTLVLELKLYTFEKLSLELFHWC